MNLKITLPTLFLFCSSLLIAQKREFKFGKITEEELEMTACDFYPEATSMVIAKTGNLKFAYNNDKGWQYRLDITIRKKVFKNTDKDLGNIKISIYNPVKGVNKEEINGLKATTYNLVNGKIVSSKLSNSDKFETRLSDYTVETSFALPDVQEGSVIEYKYSILSDYIMNLTTWHFQSDVPTGYSDFEYTIPEYFRYQSSQVGNYVALERTEDRMGETFTYTWETLQGQGGQTSKGTGSMSSNSTRVRMIARNIIPVEEEPHMNNKPNLPARVEFQLSSIQMPNSPVKNMASDYSSFTREIMGWSSFGGTLGKGGFAKDFIATIQDKNATGQAAAIYQWVASTMSWNEYYGVTSDNAGRQAFKDQSGSTADINLTLVSALREAGLQADPVILSTRGHGIAHPVYPDMKDFNYVVALVSTSDGSFLLDATSRLPFGVLPTRCLNGKGWQVSETGGNWVNLKNGSHSTSVAATIDFTEDEIRSNFLITKEGYAAVESHGEIKKKGVDDFRADMAELFAEETFETFIVPDSNSSNSVKINFELVKDYYSEDIIYLNPLKYGAETQNPYKRETRFSPIDYPYGFVNQVLVTINIPEGYEAELPQPTAVRLPDKGGSFVYSASKMNNTITVLSKMDIRKTDFMPEEYPGLKQFYQLVADKNNEMIVLKKI